VRFLAPSPAADVLRQDPALRIGPLVTCPRVAAAGRTVAAAGWLAGGQVQLRAVFADEGGAAPPAILAAPKGGVELTVEQPALAAGDAGDVVVAWADVRSGGLFGPNRVQVRAARRAPAGGFGPAQAIGPRFRVPGGSAVRVAAGVDAAGAATVVWVHQRRGRGAPARVLAATAPAREAAFGAPQELTRSAEFVSDPVVATAPGGTLTLVAYGSGSGLRVHERGAAAPGGSGSAGAPGPAPFGPAAPVGEGDAAAPVAALAPDGGAALAWRTAQEGAADAGVALATRSGRGPFGEAQRLALGARAERADEEPAELDDFLGFLDVLGGLITALGTFVELGPATPELALAPDGRFAVAWLGVGCPCTRGDLVLVPRAAEGSLDRAARPAVGLGSRLRSADAAVAFAAGGEPGVAWADNEGGWVIGGFEVPWRNGRIGVAGGAPAAGIAAPPRAPAVTLSAAPQRLAAFEPLRVRVTCDAPCDVRAAVPGRRVPFAAGSAWLNANEPRVVPLTVLAGTPLPRQARVVVRAAPPGGGPVTTARTTVRTGRRRSRRTPRILDLAARREGEDVVVTFRTSSPVYGALVAAGFDRGLDDGLPIPARARTEFALRLLAPRRPPPRVHVAIVPLGAPPIRRASAPVR
jgi:hypothetical protein